MKHVLFLSGLVLAIGCGEAPDEGLEGTAAEETFGGAPLTEPSGACPSLAKKGSKTIVSNGIERDVLVYFPKDPPPGLPVVFFWHGMGDSALGISNALDLEGFARRHDAIVVVPQSTDPMLITWDIIGGGDDAVLFDDMRSCVVQELGADVERVSTTGFSFGALFSTWLVMERGDSLSAAVTLSGGTDDGLGFGYRTPASQVPVLLMSGGTNDGFSNGLVSMDFYEASKDFAAGLRADGHLVTWCEHGLGHTLPMDWEDAVVPWLFDHRFEQVSPFKSDLGGLPAYCSAEVP